MGKNFSQIYGYEDIKLTLKQICDMITHPQKYERFNVRNITGLMLYGEPGVGKTSLAEAMITECGCKSFICRKDQPDGDFIKKISSVFQKAKRYANDNKKVSIILLEDLDKFSESDSKCENHEEFSVIQACIDDIKDSDVFVIATANNIRCLPASLLRSGRFDTKIEITPPAGEDSVKIIDQYLKQKNYISNIDIETIARVLDGYSCADLEHVISEAGRYAAFHNKKCIEMEDVVNACLKVLYGAPMFFRKDENPYLLNICYHEAGHCIVNEVLEPGSVGMVSVCNSMENNISGMTCAPKNKYYFHSKNYMENRVIGLLAGRAATDIVFHQVDVGSGNDISRAFKIVSRFVDDYCSFGFDYREVDYDKTSPNLLNRREQRIYSEIERYYQKAKDILYVNREALDAVANALFEKTTLTQKEIAEIINNTESSKTV